MAVLAMPNKVGLQDLLDKLAVLNLRLERLRNVSLNAFSEILEKLASNVI